MSGSGTHAALFATMAACGIAAAHLPLESGQPAAGAEHPAGGTQRALQKHFGASTVIGRSKDFVFPQNRNDSRSIVAERSPNGLTPVIDSRVTPRTCRSFKHVENCELSYRVNRCAASLVSDVLASCVSLGPEVPRAASQRGGTAQPSQTKR
jgi:hypothetical protein